MLLFEPTPFASSKSTWRRQSISEIALILCFADSTSAVSAFEPRVGDALLSMSAKAESQATGSFPAMRPIPGNRGISKKSLQSQCHVMSIKKFNKRTLSGGNFSISSVPPP